MHDSVYEFPFYKQYRGREFPVVTKDMIQKHFPHGFLTPEVEKALAEGRAQYVTTTGTNHDRMQLIRPNFFLLNQYFKIWKQHPEIGHTFEKGCIRVSLTTYRATQHVTSKPDPSREDRRFGERTLYVNKSPDPQDWNREELLRILEEISESGPYHLDGDPLYIAMFIKKLKEEDLLNQFPQPESTIHAYEMTSANTSAFLAKHLNCPVVDLYGSTELGFIMSRSYQGLSQFYLDDLELELLPLSPSVAALIVTSTRNPYMPLIRYRCGDCVEVRDSGQFPENIVRVLGREKEMTGVSGNSLTHGQFDSVIRDISENIFLYRLDLDATARFFFTTFDSQPLSSELTKNLKELIEKTILMPVEIHHTSALPPTASGKYPWVRFHQRSYDG